jgi:hypothetical protein
VSAPLPALGGRERRLLLACARVELDPADAETAGGLLSGPLDWDAVLSFAQLHGVAPLLHRHVETLDDAGVVPPEPRRRLLALAQGTAYRNRTLAGESARLAAAFRTADVPVIEVRGPGMVEHLYGRLGLRPIVDLMFLVAAGDLQAAGLAADGQGYSRRHVRSIKAMYHWLCPQSWHVNDDLHGLPVLLKTEIVDWPRRHGLTSERLWAQARAPGPEESGPLRLSPADLILSRCLLADVHGFFNRAALGITDPEELLFAPWSNNRLLRFVDIHQAVRREGDRIDWDALVHRARSCHIEDAVRASLELTGGLLGPTVPAQALQTLAPGSRPRLRRAGLAVANSPARRRPLGRPLAFAWEQLGVRRQIEVFRLIGLLELAFPGSQALRHDHGPSSRPKLAWLSTRRGVGVMLRCAREFLASRRRLRANA